MEEIKKEEVGGKKNFIQPIHGFGITGATFQLSVIDSFRMTQYIESLKGIDYNTLSEEQRRAIKALHTFGDKLKLFLDNEESVFFTP